MPDCLFCKFADHTVAVKAVYEDELCLAFPDINPQAPTHLLLISKEHFPDVGEARYQVLGHLLKQAAALGRRELPGGYRIVVNTGADGGQTVLHLHLHVMGGRAMGWPPG